MVKADLVIRVEPGPYGSVRTGWAEHRQNRNARWTAGGLAFMDNRTPGHIEVVILPPWR